MNVQLSIKEIMTTGLYTVQQHDKLRKAIEIFAENTFHHLPVLGVGGNIVGILSREDIFRFAFQRKQDKSVELCEISDVMTPNPMVLDVDDSVGLAADVFLANKFHAVPVTNGEELVGIITSHDLLDYAYSDKIVHSKQS
jgi:acetoin utilization protein AcuB